MTTSVQLIGLHVDAIRMLVDLIETFGLETTLSPLAEQAVAIEQLLDTIQNSLALLQASPS